jgi:hypothetical protein
MSDVVCISVDLQAVADDPGEATPRNTAMSRASSW